jgi:hypothetical protein
MLLDYRINGIDVKSWNEENLPDRGKTSTTNLRGWSFPTLEESLSTRLFSYCPDEAVLTVVNRRCQMRIVRDELKIDLQIKCEKLYSRLAAKCWYFFHYHKKGGLSLLVMMPWYRGFVMWTSNVMAEEESTGKRKRNQNEINENVFSRIINFV